MSTMLFILNDAPYGNERSYNALRLAGLMAKSAKHAVRVFLLGDSVTCAKAGQKVPAGYYNIGDMLGIVVRHGGEALLCGTCLDARGIAASEIVDGTRRGTLGELAEWTAAADRVLVF